MEGWRMKTKVYIVTEDAYEPMIYGIYESRELAQMRIDSFDGNSSLIIEERELNPDKDELLKGYKLYDVTLHRKGTRLNGIPCLQDEIKVCRTYGEVYDNFTQPDKSVFIALYAKDEADAVAKFKTRLKEKGIEYSETDN